MGTATDKTVQDSAYWKNCRFGKLVKSYFLCRRFGLKTAV
jgi:hypothetical protein